MSTDQAIEQEIQAKGLTAPRITPADIQAAIKSEHYFTAAEGIDGAAAPVAFEFYNPRTGHAIVDYVEHTHAGHLSRENGYVPLALVKKSSVALESLGLLTFCVLVLQNGFTVTGESACASPENFDAELGKKIARRNAEAKIWPLLGYELRTILATEP